MGGPHLRAAYLRAALVVGVGALIAACSSAPSVANYDSQANSTCKSYSQKLRVVDSAVALSALSKETGRLRSSVASALAAGQQEATTLDGLGRPAGESAQLQKAFDLQNSQIADLRALSKAIRDRNGTATQAAESKLQASEAPLDQRLDVLGLTSCGSGALTSPTQK